MMYTCVHTLYLYMYAFSYAYIHNIFQTKVSMDTVCMYACMNACMYGMLVCMHAYIHIRSLYIYI